jgi:putative ABC transport system substrate-binding protein
MRRIGLAVVLAVSLILGSQPTEAQQQTGKVLRVGIITFARPEQGGSTSVAPFRQRLLELGYVEGQTLVLEVRSARGREEILPDLASELVRIGVDVIYVAFDQGVMAAKQATSTIPVVMVACDAVAAGLIESLSRPGGNVTGITCMSSEISGKRLELFREVVPRVSRLGVV